MKEKYKKVVSSCKIVEFFMILNTLVFGRQCNNLQCQIFVAKKDRFKQYNLLLVASQNASVTYSYISRAEFINRI